MKERVFLHRFKTVERFMANGTRIFNYNRRHFNSIQGYVPGNDTIGKHNPEQEIPLKTSGHFIANASFSFFFHSSDFHYI
jgi:hypothetical protein